MTEKRSGNRMKRSLHPYFGITGASMKICVIGTGYVGLVAGTCLSESGNDVVCVDSDEKKISVLSSGTPTIHERGLGEYFARNIRENRLSFTTDLKSAAGRSKVVFIAVGTPAGPDMKVDISAIRDVAARIGKSIAGYTTVVIKSTVPVGTAREVRETISGLTKSDFSVVSNPEFLKEGAAVNDFMKPERVVIGTEPDDALARETMRELYAPFLRTGKPLIEMSNESAEVCKYACNGLLATKVSFMNEIANFCDKTGADINEVRTGMGADPRIGPQFLFPGTGFGGSCFPKDISGLIARAQESGSGMSILEAVRDVNERQKGILASKIREHFGGELSGLKGAVWGLSFKPGTDDVREAPAITLAENLLDAGVRLSVFDPVAMDNFKKIFGDGLEYVKRDYEALKDADFLALVTEWNEFRRPDFDRIKSMMRQPVVFDGRNIYSRRRMEKLGFTYYGIGC